MTWNFGDCWPVPSIEVGSSSSRRDKLGLPTACLPYDADDGAVVHLNVTAKRLNRLDVIDAVIATEDDFRFQLFRDEKGQRGLACAALDDEGDRPNDG